MDFTWVCVSERANVFLNNNRIRRSRLNAVVRRSANVYEHWTISPALCKQTHVNNVINRHLIFVKCLLGFERKEQITNRGNKTDRPSDRLKFFCCCFQTRTYHYFKCFSVCLWKYLYFYFAVCQLQMSEKWCRDRQSDSFPSFYWKFKRQICILEHDFLIIFLLMLWKWLFNWKTWPAGCDVWAQKFAHKYSSRSN